MNPKYSIVIGTYNHLYDALIPCIESIKKKTNLEDKEVIIVANGCTEDTREYVNSLGEPFKLLWYDNSLGFTVAYNKGMKLAQGEYIILLNNDIILLDEQETDAWIKVLEYPFFSKSNVGITGPSKFSWQCGNTIRYAIGFWCAMIHRKVIDDIGLLDEIFSPGMGEDGDYCIRAEEAGYKLIQVPLEGHDEFGTGISNHYFMIWHKGNGTFDDCRNDKYEIIERNNKILLAKYGEYK
jgi:GT2 family glycosyltransferase